MKICIATAAVFVLLLCAADSRAQVMDMPLLRRGANAAHAAYGDSYTAFVSGQASLYGNPAGLAGAGVREASVTYQRWLGNSDIYAFGGSMPVADGGGVGVSLSVLDSDGIFGSDEDMLAPSNQYISFAMGYGQRFGWLRGGIALKIVGVRVDPEGVAGFTIDGGLQALLAEGDLQLGLSIHNLGSMGESSIVNGDLPAMIRAGIAAKPVRVFTGGSGQPELQLFVSPEVVFDLVTNERRFHGGIGIEVDDVLVVRGGYLSGDPVKRFTTGLGLMYESFTLDYAFLPLREDFDSSSHQISISYRW